MEIPFDEIGFISMFLAIQVKKQIMPLEKVEVVVLMHGRATASSMLETAQELLETTSGYAMNMSLDTEVGAMYEKLLAYVSKNKDKLSNGLLLLTDMGSLNSFATLIYEETGIRTKAISMSSTMIVLEALRMAESGRSLEDIYQNIQRSFETIVQEQFRTVREAKGNKKAVIVTCFTGEGVAAKLYQRIYPVVDQEKVEIIQMQFIEKETFKKHIDGLLEEYEIKAIAGTVDIDYQNIPFFSAYDVFDDERLNVLKRIVSDEVPIEKIVRSLENTLTHVGSVYHLIESLQRIVHQVQNQLHVTLEPTVDAGLVIHLAFLVESNLKKEPSRAFKDLASFQKRYRIETDVLRTNLLQIEKNYQIKISEDEIAYLTQMFLENEIKIIMNPHTILVCNEKK